MINQVKRGIVMPIVHNLDFDIREQATELIKRELNKRDYDVVVAISKRGLAIFEACKDNVSPLVISELYLNSVKAKELFSGSKTVLIFDYMLRSGSRLNSFRKQLVGECGVKDENIYECVIAKYFGYKGATSCVNLCMSDLNLFSYKMSQFIKENAIPYLHHHPRVICSKGITGAGFVECGDKHLVMPIGKEELEKKAGRDIASLIEIAYLEADVYESKVEIVSKVVIKPVDLDSLLSIIGLREENPEVVADILTYILASIILKLFIPSTAINTDYLKYHFDKSYYDLLASDISIFPILPMHGDTSNLESYRRMEELFAVDVVRDIAIKRDAVQVLRQYQPSILEYATMLANDVVAESSSFDRARGVCYTTLVAGDLAFITLKKFREIFYLYEFVAEETHYEDLDVCYNAYKFVFNRLESVFGELGNEFNIFNEEKVKLFVSRINIFSETILGLLSLTGEPLMSVEELEEYERKCIPLVEELDNAISFTIF
jgi:hypothetical protein